MPIEKRRVIALQIRHCGDKYEYVCISYIQTNNLRYGKCISLLLNVIN